MRLLPDSSFTILTVKYEQFMKIRSKIYIPVIFIALTQNINILLFQKMSSEHIL